MLIPRRPSPVSRHSLTHHVCIVHQLPTAHYPLPIAWPNPIARSSPLPSPSRLSALPRPHTVASTPLQLASILLETVPFGTL